MICVRVRMYSSNKSTPYLLIFSVMWAANTDISPTVRHSDENSSIQIYSMRRKQFHIVVLNILPLFCKWMIHPDIDL